MKQDETRWNKMKQWIKIKNFVFIKTYSMLIWVRNVSTKWECMKAYIILILNFFLGEIFLDNKFCWMLFEVEYLKYNWKLSCLFKMEKLDAIHRFLMNLF
jgi:hypothetical protein